MGIAYQRGLSRWVELVYHIDRRVYTWVAKVATISKALQIFREQSCRATEKPSTVVIYSDCQRALLQFRESQCGNTPLGLKSITQGILAAKDLKQLGIEVELHWIPDNSRTKGTICPVVPQGVGRDLNQTALSWSLMTGRVLR